MAIGLDEAAARIANRNFDYSAPVEDIRQRLAPDETVYALAPVTVDGRPLMLVIVEGRIFTPGYGLAFRLEAATLHAEQGTISLNAAAGKMLAYFNPAEAHHVEAGLAAARTAARRTGITRRQRIGRALGFAAIGAVAAVLAIGAIAAVTPTAESTASVEDVDYGPMTDTELAANACEDKIKEGLKAPSTAQFEHRFGDRTDSYMFDTINVDAQNGFGAMLRSRHLCKLEKKPGSDYFTVSDVIPLMNSSS